MNEPYLGEYPPCPLCGVPMGLVEAHRLWHVNQSTYVRDDWEAFLHEWAWDED